MSDSYSFDGGFGGYDSYAPGFGGPSMGSGFDLGSYNPTGGADFSYLGGSVAPVDPSGFVNAGTPSGFDPGAGFGPDMTGMNGGVPGYGYAGSLPGYEAPPATVDGLGAMPQQPQQPLDTPSASLPTTLQAPQALAPSGPMAGGSEIGGTGSDERIRASTGGPAAGSRPNESVLSSLGIKNPAQTLLGAAGLAYNMARGQGPGVGGVRMTPEMMASAARLDSNGQQLMKYLESGTLPPGLKASLDQATAAAKAKVIQNFASQGMPTDPAMNSVLAQQLAQIDQQAIITTAQIGQQLMDTGLKSTGLSSDLYRTLAGIDQTQTANVGRAIANFAAALNGAGSNSINLKVT